MLIPEAVGCQIKIPEPGLRCFYFKILIGGIVKILKTVRVIFVVLGCCSGLNENVPQMFKCLNTWPQLLSLYILEVYAC